MTKTILHFTPRAEVGAAGNIKAFVDLCRKSEVLNACIQFDENVWDVGYVKGHNKVVRAVFSTLQAAANNSSVPSLPRPFLDFAKATLVYLHDKRPVAMPNVRIAALRCLETALRQTNKGSRPTAADEGVFDAAVECARAQMSPGVAYAIAGQLSYIAEFMHASGFITLRRRWAHGLRRPSQLGSRISKAALDARQKKLPSAAVLRAIGGIFQEAVEPGDVLVSSFTSLMLCAPERINEVLRLRRNCLVEGDGEYRGKLGLRWAGSKGFADTTKWIPSEMAFIAREAVGNIVKATEPARRLADWYTQNRGSLYLHESAEHLRGREVLTMAEVALILWGDETAARGARDWVNRTKGLEKIQLRGRAVGCRFADIERVVVAMLPRTFPYVPGDQKLLCRDAAAIARVNELHPMRPTFLCMFRCVDYTAIRNQFGGAGHSLSIFGRFHFQEDDGTTIVLRSHSLRHYLNMLAQTGGLSSAEIAIFSGRKDVKQNRVYDHMTSDEVQAPISLALKGGFTSELEPMVRDGRRLVRRNEFKTLGLTAAHTTEFGWCAHDFASEPCPIHRDCINCEEQECIKGESHKEKNLRYSKGEADYLLKQAREALTEEEYGADTWVKHQMKTLERVNALLSIMEDPAVPIGAHVRLDVDNVPLITTDTTGPARVGNATRREALV